MSDPTRWLHAGSDAEPVERQLLESLRREGPDDAARSALWQQLAGSAAIAGLAVAAAPTVTSGALAGGTKTGLGAAIAALVPKAVISKVMLATVLVGAGVGGVAVLRSEPAPVHTQVVREVVAPPAPVADTQVVVPTAEVEEPATVAPVAVQHAARHPSRQGERLLKESRLLTDARSALRGGDVSGALLLLRRLTREMPRGELLQERQVLMIEALAASGELARARKLAAAFVETHPSSPHNLTLRRFLDAP